MRRSDLCPYCNSDVVKGLGLFDDDDNDEEANSTDVEEINEDQSDQEWNQVKSIPKAVHK